MAAREIEHPPKNSATTVISHSFLPPLAQSLAVICSMRRNACSASYLCGKGRPVPVVYAPYAYFAGMVVLAAYSLPRPIQPFNDGFCSWVDRQAFFL